MQTLPNILTFSRILVIPFFVMLFFIDAWWRHSAQFFIFAAACLTDYFDGYMARAYQVTSRLGQVFDPIADKILVSVTLLMLTGQGTIKGWSLIPAAIILTREILVSGFREFLSAAQIPKIPLLVARIKTFFQMLALSCLLLAPCATIWGEETLFYPLGLFLLWFSALLTLWTGYLYWKLSAPYLT